MGFMTLAIPSAGITLTNNGLMPKINGLGTRSVPTIMPRANGFEGYVDPMGGFDYEAPDKYEDPNNYESPDNYYEAPDDYGDSGYPTPTSRSQGKPSMFPTSPFLKDDFMDDFDIFSKTPKPTSTEDPYYGLPTPSPTGLPPLCYPGARPPSGFTEADMILICGGYLSITPSDTISVVLTTQPTVLPTEEVPSVPVPTSVPTVLPSQEVPPTSVPSSAPTAVPSEIVSEVAPPTTVTPEASPSLPSGLPSENAPSVPTPPVATPSSLSESPIPLPTEGPVVIPVEEIPEWCGSDAPAPAGMTEDQIRRICGDRRRPVRESDVPTDPTMTVDIPDTATVLTESPPKSSSPPGVPSSDPSSPNVLVDPPRTTVTPPGPPAGASDAPSGSVPEPSNQPDVVAPLVSVIPVPSPPAGSTPVPPAIPEAEVSNNTNPCPGSDSGSGSGSGSGETINACAGSVPAPSLNAPSPTSPGERVQPADCTANGGDTCTPPPAVESAPSPTAVPAADTSAGPSSGSSATGSMSNATTVSVSTPSGTGTGTTASSSLSGQSGSTLATAVFTPRPSQSLPVETEGAGATLSLSRSAGMVLVGFVAAMVMIV